MDNATDPGWCVWCGAEIPPAGGVDGNLPPVPAPPEGPVFSCTVTAHATPSAPAGRPKPPGWFTRMANRRGGDVS